MGFGLAEMLFGGGIVGVIAGLIGGAIWGSKKLTAYENSVVAYFRGTKQEIIKEHGPPPH